MMRMARKVMMRMRKTDILSSCPECQPGQVPVKSVISDVKSVSIQLAILTRALFAFALLDKTLNRNYCIPIYWRTYPLEMRSLDISV